MRDITAMQELPFI